MILAVVGSAGSGKDTVARMLEEEGCNVVCSYTTRPMRHGEVDGKEHFFVNVVPQKDQMLAYTRYGGYEYWTLKEQIKCGCINVYVVDEVGLIELHKKTSDIFSLYISADRVVRSMRGVTEDRMKRDDSRVKLKHYDFHIINNGTIEDLRIQVKKLLNKIHYDNR